MNLAVQIRGKAIYVFHICLRLHTSLKKEEIIDYSKRIEEGIYQQASSQFSSEETYFENSFFHQAYHNIFMRLYHNLNPNSIGNEALLVRLIEGDISPEELATLSGSELFPERNIKPEFEVFAVKKAEDAPDGILKCGRCKSYKTSYYELQTRAQDEPSTKFCNCLNCGNRWRFC